MTGEPHNADASVARPQPPRRFQVLALDGGGAKALFSAHVLERLEADLTCSVADSFDLIAGTSAGGILALGLGEGLAPAEIVEHYSRLTQLVFPRSRLGPGRHLARALRPAYPGSALRDVLTEVLGDRVMGQRGPARTSRSPRSARRPS